MSSSHTHLWLKELLRISRPRFWIYVLGPMLLYFAWSRYLHNIYNTWWNTSTIVEMGVFFIILGYFTLPANLRIYGWNDIADEDTDMLNDKKWAYEANIHTKGTTYKKALKRQIRLWNIGYVILWSYLLAIISTIYANSMELPNMLPRRIWWLVLFLISIVLLIPFWTTAYLYSCKPLRAKAKPFIDGIMNILYIITPLALSIWSIYLRTHNHMIFSDIYHTIWIAWLSWLLRCMAMHCYSAIPDIEPDKQAWLRTTAVFLKKQYALIYCWLLYSAAAIVSYPILWRTSIVWGVIYLTMIMISYTRKEIFWLYKIFPYINFIVWFWLFWVILLK